MSNTKREDKIINLVENELKLLGKDGDVTASMKNINKLKYPEPKEYGAQDIVKLRKKMNVSQAVLALMLNSTVSAVQKWENGVNKPQGAVRRLLQIVEKHGASILQHA